MATNGEFRKRIENLDTLLGSLEGLADPNARDTSVRVVQELLDLHGQALARIMEHIGGAGEAGRPVLDAIAQDELVGSVLLVHGLHPLDLPTRVRAALQKVQPYLGSHGGRVELLDVTEDAVVRLRLEGSCHGCPSSRMTLKNSIEEALLAAAPEIAAIEVEGLEEAPPQPAIPGFVPVSQVLNKVGAAFPNGCEIPAL